MTETQRAALYVRVSKDEQHHEQQLHELHAVAQQRGWVVTEYVDHGESGAKDVRPALQRLQRDCAAGKVDLIAVVRLDRLGRSLRHLVDLVARLDAWSVQLVSLHEAIDTTTPAGRLTLHIFGALAEFERELIRERTRAGVARARRQGKRLGRPRRIVATELAQRRLDAGESLRSVARDLGIGPSTLRRHLDRAASHNRPTEAARKSA